MTTKGAMRWWLWLVALTLLTGCGLDRAVKRQVQRAVNTARGEYYLENGRYKQGIEVFEKEVAANPVAPGARFYLGRYYLADGQKEKGLMHLEKAAQLDPGNADFHFWRGVAHSTLGNRAQEREAYRKVLQLDPDHPQALNYLGHNLLAAGKAEEALDCYQRSLAAWPDNPQALYNRALALKRLGRDPEEKIAWLAFLENCQTGVFARKAAYHLNAAGHFEYRNHRIGSRTVTLARIEFHPFSNRLKDDSRQSLKLLGEIFSRQKGNRILHVLVYQKKNRELARKRAVSIRTFLLQSFPDLSPARIRASWFDVPEVVVTGKRKQTQDTSVHFFTGK